MKTLLIVLFFTLAAFGQQPSNFEAIQKEAKELRPRFFSVGYNKFGNYAWVKYVDSSRPPSIECTVIKTDKDVEHWVTWGMIGDDWKWIGVSTALLMIDGERSSLANGIRKSEVNKGFRSVYVKEELQFKITPEVWQQMFSAKVLEMQIARQQFTIHPNIMANCEKLRALGEKLNNPGK